MKLFSFALLCATQLSLALQAEVIHEAYLTPISGEVASVVIDQAPPEQEEEAEPSKGSQPGEKWIAGYWSWNDEENDFEWVGGVWRKPPPGQYWIPGEWDSLDGSWMWLNGFWSDRQLADLRPIPQAPPPAQEKEIDEAPSDNLFWKSGYWKWDGKVYHWQKGSWAPFEQDRIWIPPHYEWRP
ncbi:MAG: YXWGXW repeat-containing protein, partial [Verrucomicrobia bacterium]|nr:YXWGXW repeat-containing protein [Verrucomicrobiota bacterium]